MNESTLVPREEMSDLDWLARNVHLWDSDFGFIVMLKMKNSDNSYMHTRDGSKYHPYCMGNAVLNAKPYSKAQWLSRRAELQNKPSWKDAIPAAAYLAQDASGEWTWFGREPEQYSDRFDVGLDGYEEYSDSTGEVLGDWRDTLERRPERAEFEPFVSVEDIGAVPETAGQQYRREIQEIALNKYNDAMKDAATAKQPAPKGSGNPILGMVLADLTNRALEGKEKYGEPLLAHNGRRSVVDLLQELYDAAMYCRQLTEELSDLGGDLKSCIHAVAEVKCLEGEELAKHVSLLKLISSKSSALLAR